MILAFDAALAAISADVDVNSARRGSKTMAALDFPCILQHYCFALVLLSDLTAPAWVCTLSDAVWPRSSFSRAQTLAWKRGHSDMDDSLILTSLFPLELPFFSLSYSSFSVFFSQTFSFSPSERVWFRALFIAGLLGSEYSTVFISPFFQMLCFFPGALGFTAAFRGFSTL